MFFLLSTQPDKPTWLIWHRHRSPCLSTDPDEPLWLIWCSFCFPHTHCRLPYLSMHPDEPIRLIWCSFCFPRSQTSRHGLSGIVVTRLTSPHTQMSLLGSSGVLFAFHTPHRSPYLSTHRDGPYWLAWFSFCFPHNRRRFPYLSTHPYELFKTSSSFNSSWAGSIPLANGYSLNTPDVGTTCNIFRPTNHKSHSR